MQNNGTRERCEERKREIRKIRHSIITDLYINRYIDTYRYILIYIYIYIHIDR
jgi:hypothetical protein